MLPIIAIPAPAIKKMRRPIFALYEPTIIIPITAPTVVTTKIN